MPDFITHLKQIDEAAAAVRERVGVTPDLALVLGSGLGGVVDQLADARTVLFSDLPFWPVPAVVGHKGELVVGRLGDREVLVLSGRGHTYEGHDRASVALPIRVLGQLGVRTLVLTNAAGGINPAFAPGDLMLIDDHINLMGTNPLIGPNDDRLGPRFPDMSEVYSSRLRALADGAAQAAGLALAHGVYLAVTGPSYETPAEIRAFRTLGADAVGMSTVPEAIVACHAGIEVLGLSCIANLAAGLGPSRLTAEEVVATTSASAGKVLRLLEPFAAQV